MSGFPSLSQIVKLLDLPDRRGHLPAKVEYDHAHWKQPEYHPLGGYVRSVTRNLADACL
jgi:hypothetical protein